ncbi:hypothetical protein DRN63_00760 [Nanoarchaeota archaeon]|nr:MAG: hypothetical protein DRN63_00760 [Nanoarchaeota archaeon]
MPTVSNRKLFLLLCRRHIRDITLRNADGFITIRPITSYEYIDERGIHVVVKRDEKNRVVGSPEYELDDEASILYGEYFLKKLPCDMITANKTPCSLPAKFVFIFIPSSESISESPRNGHPLSILEDIINSGELRYAVEYLGTLFREGVSIEEIRETLERLAKTSETILPRLLLQSLPKIYESYGKPLELELEACKEEARKEVRKRKRKSVERPDNVLPLDEYL